MGTFKNRETNFVNRLSYRIKRKRNRRELNALRRSEDFARGVEVLIIPRRDPPKPE
jgi:hypothetical protein